MAHRDDRADNIRFLLIVLVVYAHLLEYIPGDTADWLYRLVYSFHMPAFLFLTGYFAKFRPGRILLSLVWPYFLFQTLYKLFYGYVLRGAESVELTYTTPYWLLWYLMASVFYYLLIPMLQQTSWRDRALVLAGVTAVSLLAGLDSSVGYYLTLSRFFCYLPFFVTGYYAGHREKWASRPMGKRDRLLLLAACLVVLIFAQGHILGEEELFRRNVLYGSYSYEREDYAWTDRALLHLTAFLWIVVLFLIMPGRKLPLISLIGRNTLPIFLFHGFVIRLIGKEKVFVYTEGENLALALGIAAALVLVFGNPVSAWICKWFFTGHWLTVFARKKEKAGA